MNHGWLKRCAPLNRAGKASCGVQRQGGGKGEGLEQIGGKGEGLEQVGGEGRKGWNKIEVR